MSPCNAYRQFAIFWIIVCAIIRSPTRGFTIPLTANITEDVDLTGEESSVLTVRHELKRPNDINNNDSAKSDSKEKFAFEVKQNSQEVSTDRLINKITKITSGTISSLDEFNKKFIHLKNNDDGIPKKQSTNGFTASSTTATKIESVSLQSDDESTKPISGFTSTEFVPRRKASNSTKMYETSTSKYNISKLKTYTLGNDLTGITLSVDELYSLKDLASSITEIIPQDTTTFQGVAASSTYINGQTSSTIPTQGHEFNTESIKSKNVNHETTNYSYSTPTTFTKLDKESIERGNTVTSTSAIIAATEPLWKKYTTLERNYITTDAGTASEQRNKADKLQRSINFDDTSSSYSPTPIEKITNEFNNIYNEFLTTTKYFPSGTEQDYTPYEFTTTKTFSRPGKIGVVSSKMAGFLDFAKISPQNVVTADYYEHIDNKNDNEANTTFEMTTMETTTPESNSTKTMESESPLTDDAKNEELFKKDLLTENEEAKKYPENRPDIHDLKEVKPLAADVANINNLAYNQTDYTLVVQPIINEKIKNTILYAVNPKYKPMKKIDIQPSKQFIRDPDDNSWRNESISSLGIVFKPKISSKSITQVLKNKTEIELSNLAERYNKGGVLDLRQRLEKIAEVRKLKKKKINKYGNTVYVDYEEGNGSGEVTSLRRENNTVKISTTDATFTTTPVLSNFSEQSKKSIPFLIGTNASMTDEIDDLFKRYELDALTTEKSINATTAEYYDTTEEYDVDYINISNIDLKKHSWPQPDVTTTPTTLQTTASIYSPERKATIQYFPPTTKKVTVYMNDYDDSFKKKVNLYTVDALPKDLRKALSPVPFATMATPPPQKDEEIKSTLSGFIPSNFNKNIYFTDNPRITEPYNPFVNEPDFNRGSYDVKHYKDFLNIAAKDDDYRNEYMPFTESPVKSVTISEFVKENSDRTAEDEYDYDQQFRKDLLNRFIANFNQNSEKFKVDFPILFNNSVIHKRVDENGRVLAASTAFMKRLYDAATTKANPYVLSKPCDPNCDKMTVELSPAYDLHYYVPEQEQKEEAE